MNKNDKYRVAAVDKAVAILEYLAEHSAATFPEICKELSLPKSTAYQTLHTLLMHDMLMLTKNKQYTLGPKMLYFGNAVGGDGDLLSVGAEVLRELAVEMGFTAHLSVLTESGHAVCIYKAPGSNYTINTTAVGRNLWVHCSASGKSLLAWRDEAEIRPWLDNITYTRYTPFTIADEEAFLHDLRLTRDRGYALDNRESENSFRGIGAPVFDQSGEVVAAISIGGIVTEVQEEVFDQYARRLQEAARAIGMRLR